MQRVIALVVAVTVVAGACGGDGNPSSFDADPAPIDDRLVDALVDGSDPDEVPAIQRNFLEGCVLGAGDSLPELAPVQEDGLKIVCGCGYNAMVAQVRAAATRDAADDASPDDIESAAVDRFLEIEEDLRAGEAVPDDIEALFAGCIRGQAF